MSNEDNKSWLGKLKEGLFKSANKISNGISDIFTKKRLDNETLTELEDLLIEADLGVETASYLISELKKNKFDKEVTPLEIKEELANIIEQILLPVAKQIDVENATGLKVILICGVNGNGKTTTIGKLANYYSSMGKRVMVAACDTFRAAAVEQLKFWAEKAGAKFISGAQNADPASVAYKAIEEAKSQNCDILFIDTAGRLQNKANLMEELSKIIRVIKKIDETAPHDTILILDATTGQNAHNQVNEFKKIVNLTGLIVTKLDGTAKAGVVISLAKKHDILIHAIGVGEKLEDLKPFKARDFATNLLGI